MPTAKRRTALITQAFRLEIITLAWMLIEAVVAIGSGIAVQSLTLIAFGIDSLIELASAAVLLWRLNVELRHGEVFAERAERAASRIGGALLFALAAYVVGSATWKYGPEEFSWQLDPADRRWQRYHPQHIVGQPLCVE